VKFFITISLEELDHVLVTVLTLLLVEVELIMVGEVDGGVLNCSKGLLLLSNGPELAESSAGPFLNCSNGLLFLLNGPVALALIPIRVLF